VAEKVKERHFFPLLLENGCLKDKYPIFLAEATGWKEKKERSGARSALPVLGAEKGEEKRKGGAAGAAASRSCVESCRAVARSKGGEGPEVLSCDPA